jgi:hypothetical protein
VGRSIEVKVRAGSRKDVCIDVQTCVLADIIIQMKNRPAGEHVLLT